MVKEMTSYNKKVNGAYGKFNIVPRSVIVINGEPILAYNYTLITNSRFESDSLSFTFPMNLIDFSEIYRNSLKKGNVVIIELWSGFLDYREKHFYTNDFKNLRESNVEIINNLLNNYKEKLNRRWVGIMKQPEWDFTDGKEPDLLHLSCGDFTTILKKYKFEKEFVDGEATAESVLKSINKHMKNFVFEFDSSVTSNYRQAIMGYKEKYQDDDNGSSREEIKYNTEGKSMYEVLEEIAKYTRTTIKPDIKGYETGDKLKYILTRKVSSEIGWDLYRRKDFLTCRIRGGEFGSQPLSKLAIEFVSYNTTDNETIQGTFPKNLSEIGNPEEVSFFSYKTNPNLEKNVLEGYAFDKAVELTQYETNGDLFLPNAFVGMEVNHQIRLFDSDTEEWKIEKNRSLNNFSEVSYVLDSITETFGLAEGGLSQKIEFSLDYNTNEFFTRDGKVTAINIPQQVKSKKNSSKQKVFDNESLPTYLNNIRKKGLV